MGNDYYVVNEQLNAYSLTSLVAHGATPAPAGGVLQSAGPPIPVSPDGTLQPGIVYPSSTDPHVKFYLPTYQLNVVNGRYATSLKWRSVGDDPNGPLAFLTVELLGVAPSAPGFDLRPVEHTAVMRIGYQLPIQSPTPAPSLATTPFAGLWTNVDTNTNGMTRLEITPIDASSATFHGYGKCQPSDCDWGLTTAHQEADALIGTYDFGFKKTQITVHRSGDQLDAQTVDTYAPNDGRVNRTTDYVLAGGATSPPATSTTLWLEAGALDPVSPNVRRCRLPVLTKPDFDRLYAIMTDSTYAGQLMVRCFATMARRTWRQILIRNPSVLSQKVAYSERNALVTQTVSQHPIEVARPEVTSVATQRIHLVDEKVSPETTRPLFNSLLLRSVPSIRSQPPAFHLDNQRLKDVLPLAPRHPIPLPIETGSPAEVAHPAPVAAPVAAQNVHLLLRRAYARPLPEMLADSDMAVRSNGAVRQAIPIRVVLGQDGKPALISISVQSSQTISPFCFPVATNAYVFDIPGDVTPTTNHILIPYQVSDGTGRVVGSFYQDSAYPDQCYYEPQAFRLPRVDTAPYLPDLRLAFLDVVSEEATSSGDTATVEARVQMSYRALPYLDPGVLDLMRAQAPSASARFIALVTESSKLSLRLPQDEAGGSLQTVAETGATVTFDQGIVDSVELSATELQQIIAFFQTNGLDGDVEATLLGNTSANVPVILSLKETAGTVFDRTFKGQTADGLYRVSVRNRIESRVSIDSLYRVTIGPGIFALPQTTAGVQLDPGATVDLDYRVTPASAEVPDLIPALGVSVQANLAALLPQLMVNQGYRADTFPVTVQIESEFFTSVPPDGGPKLSAVEVDFDCGVSVTLDAQNLAKAIHLRMPLLPWLLNDRNAKQYQYRVTNTFGTSDSAHVSNPSDWQHGEGEGTLQITPAGA